MKLKTEHEVKDIYRLDRYELDSKIKNLAEKNVHV